MTASPRTGAWAVHRATGPASLLHARPLPDVLARCVHVLDVDRPALVLGSAQPDAVADAAACAAAGVEVVRRRSGGGAVLLDPGAVVWVDVEVPRDDPRWDDDVGRAAWWVGEWLRVALDGASVHEGGLERGRWGDVVCFAGRGPGEVLDARGRKLAGMSQRRTRAGARFQCAVPLRWEPERLAGLLALDDGSRDRLVRDVADAVAPAAAGHETVVERLLAALTRF